MFKPRKAVPVNPRAAVIDELGALEDALAPFAEKIKRREALKKKVREWPAADKANPAEPLLYKGVTHLVTLGIAENQRTITSIARVKDTLGLPWLLAHAKVTLTDLDEAMPGGSEDLVSEARTGPRTLTITKAA